MIFLIITAIFTLAAFGYIEPIKQFLDSEALTFKIGNISLSVYKLFKAVIALILLLWLASMVSTRGTQYLKKLRKIKASNRALLIKAFQTTVYFLMFMVGLDILGIDLTAFAVVGGAIGIGIGFGLQKITSNFISGLILLFEKSIEEGDLVELADGTTGFVRNTGARYTLMETFESREIMIPNEDFITNRVTNWTFSNTQGRVDINIGVAYGSNLEQVYNLILEAAHEHPRCSHTPAAECYLTNFGDSSVNFTLYFWVDDIIEGRKRPRSDVLFAIWNKFKENDISIPFPQRDLHIKNPEALK
jgi:small-conductance mechanosensitive channel